MIEIFNIFVVPWDYIYSVIILLIVFFSFWRGFIQSILSLLTWVGSIIITIYLWERLSGYISHILNLYEGIQKLDPIADYIGFILSIPIIFIISLIILRKIRRIISSDIDKATLGIILDKFFGILYGFIFSYIVFSAFLHAIGPMSPNIGTLNDLHNSLLNNSIILTKINELNNNLLDIFNLSNETIN